MRNGVGYSGVVFFGLLVHTLCTKHTVRVIESLSNGWKPSGTTELECGVIKNSNTVNPTSSDFLLHISDSQPHQNQ